MPAGLSTIPAASDPECLEAWRRRAGAKGLRPWVERYVALVYSSAYRRTGSAEHAGEVTRAVFLVLARRARRLRRKTVLAGWLFHVTKVACRKRVGRPKRRSWRHWFQRKPNAVPPGIALWPRVAPELEAALDRLPSAQRDGVLLRVLLNQDSASAARVLRTSERRVNNRVARGLKKLTHRLRRRGVVMDAETLAQVCTAEGCAVPMPERLSAEILASIDECLGRRPTFKLARRTLNALAWARWRRRFAVGIPTLCVVLGLLGGIAVYIDSRSGYSRLISAFVVWKTRFDVWRVTEPAQPWPTNAATPRLDARVVHDARDLYQTTNIWLAHLSFTREQWQALEPERIDPLPNFLLPDGMILLRNPRARRSGLAGVLGYEFDWTHAGFEFGRVAFSNVAVRARGNLTSLCWSKRAFKVDLNRFAKGQKLGGLDELTFNSLAWDYSCLMDALGYEFFRDAGVPAPRTAYAWLSTSVAGRWDRKPLGLYLMVEPVDKAFVAERFGSKRTPVFKPVTYEFFKDLGGNWSAYEAIYDLKTEATRAQQQRVIELARLVTSGTRAAFAAQIGEFLDLDEFARFLAGQVLLSNYDSILADGQNFYMYLDPRSNKFGFVPWDLDAAWGDFWLAKKPEFERASIWHPWVGENRFLERVMAAEEFRRLYRVHLEDFLTRLFVPHRLHRRIDEMAAVIRDPLAAESAFRLNKFEQAVGLKPVKPSPGETADGVNHPARELKRFIEARAKSVRQQLDGKSKGMILKYPGRW